MASPRDGWTCVVKDHGQEVKVILGYQRGKHFSQRAKLYTQRELWQQMIAPALWASGWQVIAGEQVIEPVFPLGTTPDLTRTDAGSLVPAPAPAPTPLSARGVPGFPGVSYIAEVG